jgi:FimV-like protein
MTDVPAIPNPGTPVPRFDMAGFDLDLPANDFAAASALPEPQSRRRPRPPRVPGRAVAAHMEMETKLDLAIAYQEIGDKEGARELLDEVIKGGNVEQSSRASAMRAQGWREDAIALGVQYVGTAWNGYQKQPSRHTIQDRA